MCATYAKSAGILSSQASPNFHIGLRLTGDQGFELARVLLRFDHVASGIVNAKSQQHVNDCETLRSHHHGTFG